MQIIQFCTLLSILSFASATFKDPLVFTPPDSKCPSVQGRTPAILMFAPGIALNAVRYEAMLKYVQHQVSLTLNMDLYVAGIQFGLDFWATDGQFSGAASHSYRVISSIVANDTRDCYGDLNSGRDFEVPVFWAGHSRGGISVQELLHKEYGVGDGLKSQVVLQTGDGDVKNGGVKFRYAGLVLMSSALQRKFRLHGDLFRNGDMSPVLTMSGDLDGLFRVFRVAEESFIQRQLVSADSLLRPVINMPGFNHMSFASGRPNLFIRSNDIPSEVDPDRAHADAASVIASFIAVHHRSSVTEDKMALKFLLQRVEASNAYYQPIWESLLLEGSYHIKPSCTYIKDSQMPRDCWKGSPWVERMQPVMSGLSPEVTVVGENNFFRVWLINPVHLPYFKNSCDSKEKCTLHAVSIAQNTYAVDFNVDLGLNRVSADEVRVKFKSRQAAHVAVGEKEASFAELDDNDKVCQGLNQKSIEWAFENASPVALKRFRESGLELEAGGDLGPYNTGPNWIWKKLLLKEVKNESGKVSKVIVQSPSMRTSTDYRIQFSAGFHYCKLLSPARALEWIYIDSLKYQKV